MQIGVRPYTKCLRSFKSDDTKAKWPSNLTMAPLRSETHSFYWLALHHVCCLLLHPKTLKKKEGSFCYQILLWCQTMVTAVLKSMRDEWRNILKPNKATLYDFRKYKNSHKCFFLQMTGTADDIVTEQDQSHQILQKRLHLRYDQELFSKGNRGMNNVQIKKRKFLNNSLKCVLSFSGGTSSEVIRCSFLGSDQVAQTELG